MAAEIANPDVLLVDLREPDERRQNGVIPGALAAARGMIEFWADPSTPYHRSEFDPGRRVILHCASGGRSALAVSALKQLGYENLAHLEGGFKAWTETGQPIGSVTRVIDCPCGDQLEAPDDIELFKQAREHVDWDHPEMQRTDAELWQRIALDARDA